MIHPEHSLKRLPPNPWRRPRRGIEVVWWGLRGTFFPLFWFLGAWPSGPGDLVIYRWAVKVGPIEIRRWA